MQIHNLKQGSEAWHVLRATRRTASEAPVMMGASSKMKRDELLEMKKFGTEKEISAYVQKFLFDEGHRMEAANRPIIEKLIGDELYPVTGTYEIDGVNLLSSYDGLNEDGVISYEHKMWNEQLAQDVRDKNLRPEYYWQLEQQLAGGVDKVIFVASDGTPDKMEYMWYTPVAGRRDELIKGWQQFDKDLPEFTPVIHAQEAVADVIDSLPALIIDIAGEVRSTNMSQYEESAIAFIQGINTQLETDDDFANAEENVKFCQKTEKELELVKEQALAKTADISELFKTINRIGSELRSKRLALDKLVKNEKANKKNAIVQGSIDKFNEFVISINKEFGYSYITGHPHNFVSVVKGKRTLASLHGAVNDELARLKIEVNDLAQTIRTNLKVLDDKAGDYDFLFNDKFFVIQKECEDFELLVDSRVNQHKESERLKEEKAKQERERLAEKEADTQTLAKEIKPLPRPVIEAEPSIIKVEPSFTDEQLMRVYADDLQCSAHNIPSLKDKKLMTFMRGVEKRVDKACDAVYEKSGADDKAA